MAIAYHKDSDRILIIRIVDQGAVGVQLCHLLHEESRITTWLPVCSRQKKMITQVPIDQEVSDGNGLYKGGDGKLREEQVL